MRKVVIVGAARTAIGKFGGALAGLSAIDLGAVAIKESVARSGIKVEDIDDVIMGNVLQAGLGQNPARQAALRAGLPVKINAVTVNKVCGSGLQSVILAAQAVGSGESDVVVAGGMESMSCSPFILDKARTGYKLGDGKLIDSLIRDGLSDAYEGCHMGLLAERMAENFGIGRNEQDEYAALSQARCSAAMQSGKFKDEIASISVPQPKGEPVVFDTDEYPRADSTALTLGKLRPAFRDDGTVTAGNASGINDGAAAVVVMSAEKAGELGLQPIAEIISYACAGVEPSDMGLGPVPATTKALDKAGLSIADIDLVELNEAFAVQTLAVCRELGLDTQKVNVNGGAIALGHPVGASGARILVTLLYEMDRRGSEHGLATLCIGGGEGISMIVRRYPSA
ncbi:MAG TPA: acetyl-CoA C-acetyltransferase [Armatimonadota bacterium]|jgi:acetyl-CoA C-acetyltransferase